MAKCAAIARSGQPCRGLVRPGNNYCPAHDPSRQEARRRAAAKAGRSKPGRELVEAKHAIREILEGVLNGTIESRVGGVLFQGHNTLLKALDVERRWYETEQLASRVEELETLFESQKGEARRWG